MLPEQSHGVAEVTTDAVTRTAWRSERCTRCDPPTDGVKKDAKRRRPEPQAVPESRSGPAPPQFFEIADHRVGNPAVHCGTQRVARPPRSAVGSLSIDVSSPFFSRRSSVIYTAPRATPDGVAFEFFMDRDAVCMIACLQYCEENHLFELADGWTFGSSHAVEIRPTLLAKSSRDTRVLCSPVHA